MNSILFLIFCEFFVGVIMYLQHKLLLSLRFDVEYNMVTKVDFFGTTFHKTKRRIEVLTKLYYSSRSNNLEHKMSKAKNEDITNLDVVEKYETYEDYLDSQLTSNDMGYLEDEEMARQLVELGYRGLGDTIHREVCALVCSIT